MHERVGCAILAAGAGTRFGLRGEKLVAEVSKKPLLQYPIDAACASGAGTCSLIVGAGFDRVLPYVDPRRSSVFVNTHWADGLAATVALAARIHAADDACIFVLGDQPRISARDLDALISAHARDRRAIVALISKSIWGAPVLFPASDYRHLLRLQGDLGAKGYAQTQMPRMKFVEASRADAFADVDTRKDLARF